MSQVGPKDGKKIVDDQITYTCFNLGSQGMYVCM